MDETVIRTREPRMRHGRAEVLHGVDPDVAVGARPAGRRGRRAAQGAF